MGRQCTTPAESVCVFSYSDTAVIGSTPPLCCLSPCLLV